MDNLQSISHTLSIVSEIERLYVDELSKILRLSDSVVNIRQEELSKLPFHINVIESAARGKLRETGHSRILVDLLQHPVLQKSFTKLFLGVDLPFLQVDREIGNYESHIDVALYDDKHFVIVENKVNNAVEQDKQVYRYVHDIGIKQYGKDIKDIWVVYLNPRGINPPTIQSLCNGDPKTDVRDKLKKRFVVKSFDTDIIEWLQNIALPDEPFLKSAIHQYIDYLQRYFETTDDFKNMKAKIDETIKGYLKIDDSVTFKERIRLLEDQLETIDLLRDNIERMLNDAKYDAGMAKLRELLSKFKTKYSDYVVLDNLNATPANFGLQVPYKKSVVNIHLEVNENGDLYYGVICDPDKYPSKYQRIRKFLCEHFQQRHQKVQREDGMWPIWEYTELNTCEDDLSLLIEKIRSL